MNNKRKFRILSLDGGGFKGLYSAKILSEVEKRYGKIADNINLICGTSTGGIIALGLGIGKSADEIVNYFLTYGPKIFPIRNTLHKFYYTAKQLIFSSKYSNEVLNSALYSFFGNAKMRDAICNLCIPSVNLVDAEGIIFKTPHSAEFTRDAELLMKDVALATSAAPTYFPSSHIKNISSGLVDGGLWANNPAFIGAIEAVSYFVGDTKDFDEFSILSIGAISSCNSWYPDNHSSASIANWSKNIFPLTISVQSNAMNNLLKIASDKKLFPMGSYIRIDEPLINPNQMKYIDLDNASEKSISALLDLACSTINNQLNRNDVVEFFNKK